MIKLRRKLHNFSPSTRVSVTSPLCLFFNRYPHGTASFSFKLADKTSGCYHDLHLTRSNCSYLCTYPNPRNLCTYWLVPYLMDHWIPRLRKLTSQYSCFRSPALVLHESPNFQSSQELNFLIASIWIQSISYLTKIRFLCSSLFRSLTPST